jgi:hypothetical protein
MPENLTQPTSTSIFDINVPSIRQWLNMLTTLVGAVTAETVILGNYGAPGLAWATMSFFGTSRVIAVCLSGACPP